MEEARLELLNPGYLVECRSSPERYLFLKIKCPLMRAECPQPPVAVGPGSLNPRVDENGMISRKPVKEASSR